MLHRVSTKYVCGVDLHAKTLTGVVMDLGGKVERRATIPCEVPKVLELLAPYGRDVTVGVESTYNWYWFIDALGRAEIPCVLGHALYMSRKMSGKHKSDGVDAQAIADLLRTNQFPLAYSYPSEMRGVRDLLRRRHTFVRRRAGALTHFQCSLHQEGCIEPLRNKLQYKSTRDSLVELAGSADTRKMLQSDLEYIKGLDVLIDDLEKTVLQRALRHNPTHLRALQTIPGCGEITALTILYEMHRIERFRTPQQFCSYCRVIRADNSSAGKDYGGSSNDKIGNADLKWAFSEIGVAMLRVCSPVAYWHQKQAQEHGKTGAHARLRHKLALAVYSMLRHDKVFDLEKFVGKQHMAQTEQAEPGRKAPPVSRAEPQPGEAIDTAASAGNGEGVETQSESIVDISHAARQSNAAVQAEKKRGRPALPRDSQGNIIRQSPQVTTADKGPASAAHQREEKSGPNSKPSLTTAPPASRSLTTTSHGPERCVEAPRRGRPPLPRDSHGRILRTVAATPAPGLTNTPTMNTQTKEEVPLQHLLRERLAGFSQADLSNLLLSIITTGAANPAHNWSSPGPETSRLPSRLIGAAPVASSTNGSA